MRRAWKRNGQGNQKRPGKGNQDGFGQHLLLWVCALRAFVLLVVLCPEPRVSAGADRAVPEGVADDQVDGMAGELA